MCRGECGGWQFGYAGGGPSGGLIDFLCALARKSREGGFFFLDWIGGLEVQFNAPSLPTALSSMESGEERGDRIARGLFLPT